MGVFEIVGDHVACSGRVERRNLLGVPRAAQSEAWSQRCRIDYIESLSTATRERSAR